MHATRILPALALIAAAGPALAEPAIWGLQVEQLDYRFGEDEDVLAWDFDAVAGPDELRFVWRSEAELLTGPGTFETLENQARVQVPISPFFDAVGGVMVSTPEGPDRVYGVVGVHGLAPQWFEVDADLFVSDKPFARVELDYEALITNRLILTPSVEVSVPLVDDRAIDAGAFGPKLEAGLRLSYDVVDRLVSPYVGVHYERYFGDSADLRRASGEATDAVYFVVGTKILF